MKYRVKHFEIREFACRCCGRAAVTVALVFWLDVLRRSLGQPLHINSGFRCAAHNARVDGSASSRHLIGCAADVAKPERVDYDVFFQFARRLSCEGWEAIEYPSRSHIHLAVPRDQQSRVWNGERVITV